MSSVNQKYLKDENNETFSPIVSADSVYIDDGNSVKSRINGIIESGSNSNGKWIKWEDGTMICRKTMVIVVPSSSWSTWGNDYIFEALIQLGNFPVAFKSTPDVYVTNNGSAGWWLELIRYKSATSAGEAFICRPNKFTSDMQADVGVLAIGNWK